MEQWVARANLIRDTIRRAYEYDSSTRVPVKVEKGDIDAAKEL